MSRIDFYIAKQSTQLLLACRVIEKIVQLDHRIFVFTDDQSISSQLDEMLWSFKPDNFIAHEIFQEGPEQQDVPVLISHEPPANQHDDVLVNLTEAVPIFFNRFNRVAEIVGPDESLKLIARSRYKYYRENGYELYSHNL